MMKRSEARKQKHLIFGVLVCAALKQQVGAVRAAGHRGPVQRRVEVLRASACGRSGRGESGLLAAAAAGRCGAVAARPCAFPATHVGGCFYVGAPPQQQPCDGRVAALRSIVQRGKAVLCVHAAWQRRLERVSALLSSGCACQT